MNFSVVIEALFEGALGRPINRAELEGRVRELENGTSLLQMIADVVSSPECKEHQKKENEQLEFTLPDLTQMHPERYSSLSAEEKVFHAYDNAGIELMESLIVRYRYYERLGIWRPTVDLDKRVTAAIIEGMGARSCIELGCFSGAVLGLLAAQGIDICGVEVSHRAFLLADNCTYEKIRFGNLVDLHFDRQFDAFLGMDILEHLSPLKLPIYINKIKEIVKPQGFIYINSPMFGVDDIFGKVFNQYLPEWSKVGDTHFWYDLHCDKKGWPMHGHLVWASPVWWETLFAKSDLIRDKVLEGLVHRVLGDFFTKVAPARRSLFILRHKDAAAPDYSSIEAVLGNLITRLF